MHNDRIKKLIYKKTAYQILHTAVENQLKTFREQIEAMKKKEESASKDEKETIKKEALKLEENFQRNMQLIELKIDELVKE